MTVICALLLVWSPYASAAEVRGEGEDGNGNVTVEFMINSSKAIINNEVVLIDPELIDLPVIIQHNTAMVPIRFLAEAYGYEISWHEAGQTVTLTNGRIISLKLGSNIMTVNTNGKIDMYRLSISPRMLSDRIYLPLREVAKYAFGQWVEYFDSYHYINVSPDLAPGLTKAYIARRTELFDGVIRPSDYPRIAYAHIKPDFIFDVTADLLGISKQSAQAATIAADYDTTIDLLAQDVADIVIVPGEVLDDPRYNDTDYASALIAKDALTFFVSSDNALSNITLPQIVDVYTGQVTHYTATTMRQAAKAIEPFYQPPDSDAHHFFLHDVMAEYVDALPEMPEDHVLDDVAVLRTTRYLEGLFGYALYSSPMVKSPLITSLKLDGVTPNRITISTNNYPMIIHYYAVAKKDNAKAKALMDYLTGSDAQIAVEASGLTPVK